MKPVNFLSCLHILLLILQLFWSTIRLINQISLLSPMLTNHKIFGLIFTQCPKMLFFTLISFTIIYRRMSSCQIQIPSVTVLFKQIHSIKIYLFFKEYFHSPCKAYFRGAIEYILVKEQSTSLNHFLTIFVFGSFLNRFCIVRRLSK